ncbi:MAG TPA: hypothetical protein VL332_03475 [Candidatus Saccharimonadaceae bacterium]|nr:hypothetical protein [Candidatus Saccharimonadaceae bacterium]
MKGLAFVFIVLGILALVYGGISYSRQRTLLDVGSFQATTTEPHDIPLSPIVAAVAIVGGLLLLFVPRRRTEEFRGLYEPRQGPSQPSRVPAILTTPAHRTTASHVAKSHAANLRGVK